MYNKSGMAADSTALAFYPAGTIVSCPALPCGARLYRLRIASSFSEVVTNDDVVPTPVNEAIPARKVWEPLACPLCGTAVVDEGQLHTAERGWW